MYKFNISINYSENQTTQENSNIDDDPFLIALKKNREPPKVLESLLQQKLNNLSKQSMIIIIKELIVLLVESPLIEYDLIYNWIIKQNTANLILKGIKNVYNNYLKLADNKQLVWNGKNVKMAIEKMQNWFKNI